MMYKKVLFSFVLVGLLFLWSSKADVQDVSFKFCDDTENEAFGAWKKTFFVTPGKETEICMYFATSSEKPRKVVYGFTKAESREVGAAVCDSDKWPNNDFSKYFTNAEPREFVIDKDSPKTIKEKVLLPIGMSGVQYGCLAYSLSEYQWTNLWGMFNLVINRVFPISLFVGDGDNIKNAVTFIDTKGGAYTTNKIVKAIVDKENNLKLNFLIKNEWNVSENIEITGSIYNILWFEKSFSAQVNNLAPWKEQEVVASVWVIPFYKWFFTTKVNLTYGPNFDFDASTLSDVVKQWGTINEKAQIYVFSWVTLIIAIIVLLIVVKLCMPRKKIIINAQQQ